MATDTSSDRTEQDVEQTKSDADQDKQISKIHVSQAANGKWECEIEYQGKDGSISSGETKEFDEFSDATAWVAAVEVDTKHTNPLQQPTIDHTEDM